MTFANLGLQPKIIRALDEAGYSHPTSIQSKAIPKALRGFDILASACTGTGKSAAFLLPALQMATTPTRHSGPRVLILAPTRELTIQIHELAKKYGKYMKRVRMVSLYGGVPIAPQLRLLSSPPEVLIATPGRLLDLIKRGALSLSNIQMWILDEADRMLKMGFKEPIEEIASMLSQKRQTLFFSATLDAGVSKLSQHLLKKPLEIKGSHQERQSKWISQRLLIAQDLRHKNRLLGLLLQRDYLGPIVIFVSTKHHAGALLKSLRHQGHLTVGLHGDMQQKERNLAIKKMREGHSRILVATDVASRGIDIEKVGCVINFDLPRTVEDYIHRIGRTGRAGRVGTSYSFVYKKEKKLIQEIEAFTGASIEVSKESDLNHIDS